MKLEQSYLESFGSGPHFLDQLSNHERTFLNDVGERYYLNNPLPELFRDGVLLFLTQTCNKAFPIYFLGASLLARNVDESILEGWLNLTGWDNPAQLMKQWARRQGRPIDPKQLESFGSEDSMILARSIIATTLNPSLSVALHGQIYNHLNPDLRDGVGFLHSMWAALNFWFSSHDEIPIENETLITPYLERLVPIVSKRIGHLAAYPAALKTHSPNLPGPEITEEIAVTVLEYFPVGVLRLNMEGRIIYGNPAMNTIMGVPPGDRSPAIGAICHELPNLRDLPAAIHVKELVQNKKAISRFRFEFTSLAGKTIILAVEGCPVFSHEKVHQGSVIVMTDVTRETALEKQLKSVLHQKTLAEIAGGVAHKINDLLVGVSGYTSLLMERLDGQDPNLQMVEQLHTAGTQITALVEGLMALSSQSSQRIHTTVECNTLIQEMIDMMRKTIPAPIEISLQVAEKAQWVPIDRAQLMQVFSNLCTNARDAILASNNKNDGRISIAILAPNQNNAWVQVQVTDNGIGMDPSTLEQVFNPMFTTKPLSTGLGMAVSLGTIRSCGGEIHCKSTPEQGSTFTILLPSCSSIKPASTATVALKGQGCGQRVLVVEDNPIVRSLCSEVLGIAGYEALEASNAQEARLANHNLDLAIIDVGLPDIDGFELAEELRDNLPVLFMSGNPPERFKERLQSSNKRWAFVKKPFDISDLITSIRNLTR
ncbi:MAG TPA: PAS domain-containing hybrid sensor histidine kinase/response regulator [Myxococcales bacterium]|nr:PAS domain-containing hybrid sensor histidine kinase/response regulator [Myxococcales bacterium]HIN86311.1 PAS domain-containing hybrid sensor histidine kinase/response regulator [Myxococcales bacterium]